jgi:hypothetical protein
MFNANPNKLGHACGVGLLLAVVAAFHSSAAAQAIASEACVAYRLVETKTNHFHDAQKAEQHLQALKKLGCEASQAGHAGHIDLVYRCARWRVMAVANDELAHQWEQWLNDAGFETLHGHAAEHTHEHGHAHTHEPGDGHDHPHHGETHEAVTYRLTSWVTIHPQRESEAEELVAIAKGLGCEMRESQHAGHSDILISCPDWKHAEFASHEAAEAWQQWLTNNGFEVQHTH